MSAFKILSHPPHSCYLDVSRQIALHKALVSLYCNYKKTFKFAQYTLEFA